MREFLTTTVVRVSLVDTGPPKTSPVGSGSEWPGECHDNRSVLSELLEICPRGNNKLVIIIFPCS